MSPIPPAESAAAPTADCPQAGIIAVQIGEHQIPLSPVEHWVEDGAHVFRSTTFDCVSEAATETEAVQAFVENAEDLFRFLDDVVDAGRATDDEKLTLIKLSRCFFEIYSAAALEREAQSNHVIPKLLRALREPRRRFQWEPQQAAHGSFSQPSHV